MLRSAPATKIVHRQLVVDRQAQSVHPLQQCTHRRRVWDVGGRRGIPAQPRQEDDDATVDHPRTGLTSHERDTRAGHGVDGVELRGDDGRRVPAGSSQRIARPTRTARRLKRCDELRSSTNQ